jgi:hypothetical protein
LTGLNLPADLAQQSQGTKYYRQYDPSQPRSIARPAELPNSDLTNAFTTQQPGGGGGTTPAPAPPAGPPSNWGYGFNVHMWYFNEDAKNHTAGMIQQAGFTWLAHQVEWAQVETSPGGFDWNELDQIVNTANAYRLKVMLSVLHAPTFYRAAGR